MHVDQARFLDYLAAAARRYPTFSLVMGARVEQLIEHDGSVEGVRYRVRDGLRDVRATLVVGADGRFSRVRQLAGIPLVDTAQEADVLWLRLRKRESDPPRAYGLYPRGWRSRSSGCRQCSSCERDSSPSVASAPNA
jgi:2-polyprenyl-6-methoxyphenol hydroxylase-like FAD-dependent oxidoreductase